MKKISISIFTILFTLSSFAGDVLTLNNQMIFSGKVTKIKKCTVTFDADGKKFDIPADDIFSIAFEKETDKVYTSYMEMAKNDAAEQCMKGRLDADNHHGKAGLHVALGVLFGPFAVIGAAVSNPNPQKGKDTFMRSDNKDSFNDANYLSCYSKKAKGKNVGNAALGWLAWVLIILI
jgi:hypothetical protein